MHTNGNHMTRGSSRLLTLSRLGKNVPRETRNISSIFLALNMRCEDPERNKTTSVNKGVTRLAMLDGFERLSRLPLTRISAL